MLPLASTRTRAKSCAIIAALGEICGLVALAGLPALAQTAQAAASSSSYRVTFHGTWTRAATPGGLPAGAHFSPLIGAVHNDGVTFWESGAMASPGVEAVAELGATSTFKREIDASGHALATLEKRLPSGGTPEAHVDFEVTSEYPLVTLITMIAPSPDWFVGVSGLSLLDSGGRWVSSLEVDLFPYDAGTENGDGFSLSNPATVPQENITSIRGMGRFADEPMARLTFVRQDADPGPAVWSVPLFPLASDPDGREGFVRVINRSEQDGEVRIVAVDDAGAPSSSGPLTLSIAAQAAAHFNSDDLAMGNAEKGLSGSAASGQDNWRLELTSSLDIEVLSFIRIGDGFLTAMHDVAPSGANSYRVVVFNPASNTRQVSRLRLINTGVDDVQVMIKGTDDSGHSPDEMVQIGIAAGAARWLSAEELELGVGDARARLGDGVGKWRLTVESEHPLIVMSLLESPTGHLTNLSTAPNRGTRGIR